MATDQSPREKVFELLTAFDTAMMVTHAPSGPLDCRPMHIARVDRDGSLWFITSSEGQTAFEINKDAEVLLVMQEDQRRYLSIVGRGSVIDDRRRVQDLWREPYRTWFPKGPDDRNLVLILVRPDSAEYWDTAGMNKLRYLFEAARAYATGTRPHIDEPDQHGATKL